MKPVIAVTMGDPAGVGPEILIKALNDARVKKAASVMAVGDLGVLREAAKKLRLKGPSDEQVISVTNLDLKKLKIGKPSKLSGEASVAFIEEALYMTAIGDADAFVTCPISKEAVKKAGFTFPGHTEFIAHLTGTEDFVMMLGGKDLKVVLVTIHESLKKVPSLITTESVLKTISITDKAFKNDFGLKKPRIAVCGLNPHAGEAGMFGDEDKNIIEPAVRKARKAGIDAVGPLPSDTVFYRAVRKKEFDVVVAMYHDQGLGPLKLMHFDDGVNATLGLPVIRTSVDHGTAFDIAWQGKASHESLVAAIEMAAQMAVRRAKA
ncbi:MAG: 4-hydroxythreonine-4-phosphate dehydrogenase PdxA [Deltaproteobacteria bacterium]|nr:4-hydroxythreonine-4-phosphate dehydrogenase PdxA [Deltaproteobacteria bacterium]